MSKIIITGACGFVGSNVANRLAALGYETMNVDNLSFGNEKNLKGGFMKCNFSDLSEYFLSGYHTLIHCATSNIIYSMENPIETFNNNAANTIKLFSRFKGKIIYTSTASVYGQADTIPTPENSEIRNDNAYDQSKYIAELFLKQRGNYTTLRLSNVYGSNQRADNPFCGVIGKLCYNIINGIPVSVIGDGKQTRDFTHVNDVVDAIVLAMEKSFFNDEINIATGKETSIVELVDVISKMTKIEANINRIDPRKIDGIRRRCLNIDKAKAFLGWSPKISIEDGIAMTVNWVNNQKK